MPSRRTPKIHYPWQETPKGGGFFVPTLDVERTLEHAAFSALHFRRGFKSTVGVKGGMYGVLIVRTR